MLLLQIISDAATGPAMFNFIMKRVIILEFLGGMIPGDDDEEYAEEGPPEADAEAPYHPQHLVLKHVHHCR